MKPPYLNRSEHQELVVAPLAAISTGTDGEESDYPKSTGAAVSELKQRGVDADIDRMNYLVKKEIVLPDRVGRLLKWTAKDIDSAAKALGDEMGFLTPCCQSCHDLLGVRYADWLTSLREAHAKAIDEHGSAGLEVLGLVPDETKWRLSHEFILEGKSAGRGKVSFSLNPTIEKKIKTMKARKKR